YGAVSPAQGEVGRCYGCRFARRSSLRPARSAHTARRAGAGPPRRSRADAPARCAPADPDRPRRRRRVAPRAPRPAPGGAGDTPPPLQVAADAAGAFADGVAFVSLAPIRDQDLVVPTIAQALGLRDMGSRPLAERLLGFLRPRHQLLVLDNFEHPLGAAALLG